jgi:hypothetical protein
VQQTNLGFVRFAILHHVDLNELSNQQQQSLIGFYLNVVKPELEGQTTTKQEDFDRTARVAEKPSSQLREIFELTQARAHS